MTTEELQIKIKAETDISKLKELEAELTRLIAAAKRDGAEFGGLAAQLQMVKNKQAELAGETQKISGEIDKQSGVVSAALKTFTGFGQAQQAVARLLRGDVVGALRAGSAAVNLFTNAIKANPFTFWVGAIMAVIGLLASLKTMLSGAREKAAELSKANFEQFKTGLEESAKAAATLAQERFSGLMAATEAAINKQREYQRELERSREKQLALVDEEYAAQVANLNLRKERELVLHPEQREEIELKYRGEETRLRQSRDVKKSDVEIASLNDQIAAAAREVEAVREALAGAEQAAAEARDQRGRAIAATGAKSDQRREMDELNELNRLAKTPQQMWDGFRYRPGPGPGLTDAQQKRQFELQQRQEHNAATANTAPTYHQAEKEIQRRVDEGKDTVGDRRVLADIQKALAASAAAQKAGETLAMERAGQPGKLKDAQGRREDAQTKLNSANSKRQTMLVDQQVEDTALIGANDALQTKRLRAQKERYDKDAAAAQSEQQRALQNKVTELEQSGKDATEVKKQLNNLGLTNQSTPEERRKVELDNRQLDIDKAAKDANRTLNERLKAALNPPDPTTRPVRDMGDTGTAYQEKLAAWERSQRNPVEAQFERPEIPRRNNFGYSEESAKAERQQNAGIDAFVAAIGKLADKDGASDGDLAGAVEALKQLSALKVDIPAALRPLVDAIRASAGATAAQNLSKGAFPNSGGLPPTPAVPGVTALPTAATTTPGVPMPAAPPAAAPNAPSLGDAGARVSDAAGEVASGISGTLGEVTAAMEGLADTVVTAQQSTKQAIAQINRRIDSMRAA